MPPPELPAVESVPQEKRPVVASQRSLLVAPVSQSVRPAPENDLVAYTVAPEMVPVTASVAFVVEFAAPMPTLPVRLDVPNTDKPADVFRLLNQPAAQRLLELPMLYVLFALGFRSLMKSPFASMSLPFVWPRMELPVMFAELKFVVPLASKSISHAFAQRLAVLPMLYVLLAALRIEVFARPLNAMLSDASLPSVESPFTVMLLNVGESSVPTY